eukprot:gb/GECH01013581.1/.p1 GENE.gb/GECH01013581.1/~~gb/GECH01013581.1/.p1  ORF type:complete len:274 (+),score=84.72 gb/GECH01013581.1/:1-822(+)
MSFIRSAVRKPTTGSTMRMYKSRTASAPNAGRALHISKTVSVLKQPTRGAALSSSLNSSYTSTIFSNRQFTSTRSRFQEDTQPQEEKETKENETQEQNEGENKISVEELEEKIAQLEKENEELRGKYTEAREGHARSVADAENTRKISERNIADAKKYALQGFAKDLLEVSDNLSRALESVTEEERENSKALRTLFDGVQMTEQIFHNVLQKHGIEKFDSMGKPFDPNLHEAMFETQDPNQDSGVVSHVMQEGFTLNDRVIRPARAGVNKKKQ